MGCHTWFNIPIAKDKDLIIKKAQEKLDTDYSYLHDSEKQMYQYAIDNELCYPCCKLAYPFHKNIDWTVYGEVTDFKHIYNQPRITGYPDRIIHSYEEMVDFINTGFIDEDGIKHEFYFWDSKKVDTKVMKGIKLFFETYPEGIIYFD